MVFEKKMGKPQVIGQTRLLSLRGRRVSEVFLHLSFKSNNPRRPLEHYLAFLDACSHQAIRIWSGKRLERRTCCVGRRTCSLRIQYPLHATLWGPLPLWSFLVTSQTALHEYLAHGHLALPRETKRVHHTCWSREDKLVVAENVLFV